MLELRALRAVSCAPCAGEATRYVPVCMLDAVDEGGLCLLEVPEGMRSVLLCISRYLAFVPQGSLGKQRAAIGVTCRK